MAYLMVTQASGRKKGYTATLMNTVVDSLSQVDGIEVEVFHLHDYKFGPCKSCFSCIRNVGSGCVLKDDWGQSGEGILYQAFLRANGLLMFDPVHGWGMSAMSRVFLERVYPTFWIGTPYGMPFGSVSCASNQGFQFKAVQEFCKKAAGNGFQYLGGLPVHTAYFEKALAQAVELGMKVADAALADEDNGRSKLTDNEIFDMYRETPWSLLDGYLENLTNGSFTYEGSVPETALREGTFTKSDAHELLVHTCNHLEAALKLHRDGNRRDAAKECALAAKFWTNATFKQFASSIVNADIPAAYRPLDELNK